MSKSHNVELGDEARCKVTGFQGIITSVAKCLTGCDRVTIQPPINKEKKMADALWFDVEAVEILKKHKVKTESVRETGPTAKKGGPPSLAVRK